MLRSSRCLIRQLSSVHYYYHHHRVIGPYYRYCHGTDSRDLNINNRILSSLGGLFGSNNTNNINTQPLLLPSSLLGATRSYIFIPSSFREARHDLKVWWEKNKNSTPRRIKVKFNGVVRRITKEKWKNAKWRVLRRVPSRKAMSIKYKRWHTRLQRLGKIPSSIIKTVNVTEYSRDNWFDENGHPLTSRDEAGRFVNPWSSESTSGRQEILNFLSWRFQRLFSKAIWQTKTTRSIPSKKILPSAFTDAPVQEQGQKMRDNGGIRFTWIGHSTCLVRMDDCILLTDPQLSARAAPTQLNFPFNGVKRHVPPACSIEDLPTTIDLCLISHDHYDHLDRTTCSHLKERVRTWIVPLGIKDWLIEKCNIEEHSIRELEWWESTKIYYNEDKHSSSDFVTITCAPTQHWSCRSMWDRNHRLWCSFAVESSFSKSKFYFGGDTGYHPTFPLFRIIGERLGPFDLAALPIGAYEPQFFMAESHVTPEEAVKIHQQIGSKKSVGIHWGTFRLSDEGDDEPRQRLNEAVKNKKNKIIDFTTIPIGDSVELVPRPEEEKQGISE